MACYICDKHRTGDGVIASDDLTPDEAAALGRWAAEAARALQAEHVCSSIVGHRVDHLHLVPRDGNAEVTQRVTEIRARLDAPGHDR